MSLESCSVFLAFGKCCHSHQNVELRLAGAAMVYGEEQDFADLVVTP